MACSCYVHSVHYHVLKKETLSIQIEEDPREERSRPQPVEGVRKVEVDDLEKAVQIGAALPEEEAKALSMLLVEFMELFT